MPFNCSYRNKNEQIELLFSCEICPTRVPVFFVSAGGACRVCLRVCHARARGLGVRSLPLAILFLEAQVGDCLGVLGGHAEE
jgi:hypothetical protein